MNKCIYYVLIFLVIVLSLAVLKHEYVLNQHKEHLIKHIERLNVLTKKVLY